MTHAVGEGPRPPGARRGVFAVAAAILAAYAGCALVAPAGAAGSGVPPSQPLVSLRSDHIARTRPDPHAHPIESIAAQRPLTRVRTVLPVLGHANGSDRRSWVRVRLPGRPNGHTGWIPARQTTGTSTPWRIAIRLSARRVTVYRNGHAIRRFRAVIGKSSTPTPRGRFFIEEALALASQDPGGPYALATSARSNVLQEFDGGPGQIALHGTNNLSGALGTAASHGCVRLSTRAVTWLSERIGSGVPLTITR